MERVSPELWSMHGRCALYPSGYRRGCQGMEANMDGICVLFRVQDDI